MAHVTPDPYVLGILSKAEIKEHSIKLTEQLPPDVYKRVKKSIEAAGGKWKRASGLHEFPSGTGFITEAMAAAERGEKPVIRDRIKDFQFFPTPEGLARDLAQHATMNRFQGREFTVLEPSCGNGNLVLAVAAMAPSSILAIDVRKEALAEAQIRCAHLSMPVEFRQADFLALRPADVGRFDVVLMNPPFTRDQDLEHIIHAYSFLKPGGRLVSLSGPAWPDSLNKRRSAFHAFLQAGDGEYERQPPQDFGRTNIATVRVTLDRPRLARTAELLERLRAI